MVWDSRFGGQEPLLAKQFPAGGRDEKRGDCFRTGIWLIFILEYTFFAAYVLKPSLYPAEKEGVALAVSFHILFGLALFSIIQCIRTDGGRVPEHWAFRRGEADKRKRYCRQCHVWKPARTHHCSICNRCVLNMDHHCPWVGRCIGFFNRKFFLQLATFGVLTLGYVLVLSAARSVAELMKAAREFGAQTPAHTEGRLGDDPTSRYPRSFVIFPAPAGALAVIVMEAVTGYLFFVTLQFAIFHLRLASRNLTTIENLDASAREQPAFDLGSRTANLKQILGPTITLWWLPVHTACSQPVGDGVTWVPGHQFAVAQGCTLRLSSPFQMGRKRTAKERGR